MALGIKANQAIAPSAAPARSNRMRTALRGRGGAVPNAAAGCAIGGAAAGVVAGAAGDDAVVLVPALQPAEPDHPRLRGLATITAFCSSDPALISSLIVTGGTGRRCAGRHGRARRGAGRGVRNWLPRPRHRARADDLAVLRDADGQRADLEEPADEPGERAVRLDPARASACRRSTGSRRRRSPPSC